VALIQSKQKQAKPSQQPTRSSRETREYGHAHARTQGLALAVYLFLTVFSGLMADANTWNASLRDAGGFGSMRNSCDNRCVMNDRPPVLCESAARCGEVDEPVLCSGSGRSGVDGAVNDCDSDIVGVCSNAGSGGGDGVDGGVIFDVVVVAVVAVVMVAVIDDGDVVVVAVVVGRGTLEERRPARALDNGEKLRM